MDLQILVSIFICVTKAAECVLIGWGIFEFRKWRKNNIVVIHRKESE